MKFSIARHKKYKIKYQGKIINVLDEFHKKNNLEIMYLEDFLRIYNKSRTVFSLKDLIVKMEIICSTIGKNGHLEYQVSDECIEEKLSRHYNDKKYDIIMLIDKRNILDYASADQMKKIERAGGKKRKARLLDRYTYENPLNRIHGFVIYDKNPGPPSLNKGERALSIEIIGSNPYCSMNGFKGVGANLLLYIVIMGKIHKFDKIILEIANDRVEFDNECNINDCGENDNNKKAEERRRLENMTRKKLKKIAKYYKLALGGLKLHIINRILWYEEYSESESESYSESESDSESDSESESNSWHFHEFEPLYQDIDLYNAWSYQGKDPKIYGYGGERYIKGKNSTKELYCWYQKYGFLENKYLNTHQKYFDMTPLPSMELNLEKHKLKKLCIAFLDNKLIK